MDQLNVLDLVPCPYRYIIDTSSLLAQKDNDKYPIRIHTSLWRNLGEHIRNKIIVSSKEIQGEIGDVEVKRWIDEYQLLFIEIDDEIQANVIQVVNKNPDLVNFKQNKSSGDAFILATAMKYNLAVITEENTRSPYKIPQTCQMLNIDCVDIRGLCVNERWSF